MSFHHIPPYPAELPHTPSKNRLLTHRGKRELRAESMVRIGKGRDDRQKIYGFVIAMFSKHSLEYLLFPIMDHWLVRNLSSLLFRELV